jgi:hypothetical protein
MAGKVRLQWYFAYGVDAGLGFGALGSGLGNCVVAQPFAIASQLRRLDPRAPTARAVRSRLPLS